MNEEGKMHRLNIQQIEDTLSKCNSRLLGIDNMHTWFMKRNEVQMKTFRFYNRPLFRQLANNSFVNEQKSEDKMVNGLCLKYAPNGLKKKEAVEWMQNNAHVCFGDWDEHGKCLRYQAPTMGIGVRRLLRHHGIEISLVNEYLTTAFCSNCKQGRCVHNTSIKVKNPRPFKTNTITPHGLLQCQICKVWWNRDRNAPRNQHYAADNYRRGLERPIHLSKSHRFAIPVTGDREPVQSSTVSLPPEIDSRLFE